MRHLSLSGLFCIVGSVALSTSPRVLGRRSLIHGLSLVAAPVAAADDAILSELSTRIATDAPKQAVLVSTLPAKDTLCFPAWLEGLWVVRSRLVATAAPLGERYLPADLRAMRLGAVGEALEESWVRLG